MNMNQIVNMFTRMLMRRAMNWGVNKGLEQMSRGRGQQSGTAGTPDAQHGAGPAQGKTPQSRDMAKKMRNLNRMTRR